MKNSRPMRVLTAQLGLKLSNRTKRTTPALAKLLDGLTEINTRYSDHKGIRVIRASEDIKKEADELFDRIGSLVWPDLDEKIKFPTWLLNPSDKVSKLSKHYPRHLQYSNHADRAILAELFYPFVCGRLYNSVNNAENPSRVGKRPASKHHSSSEESSNPGEDDVSSDDNGENNGDVLPTPRAASSKSQSYTPMSAGRRRMQPNTAPVAPMFAHQSSMDNDLTELGAINSEHPKQYRRAKKSRLGQLDAGSAEPYTYTGLGGLPFHTPSETLSRSCDSSDQPQSYAPQRPKRPFVDGTSASSTKRSKISANVHIPKPSLIVTLKLTPAKDASNQDNTAPPQQSHTRMLSPELPHLDDIIAGRSTAPVNRQSDVENDDSHFAIRSPVSSTRRRSAYSFLDPESAPEKQTQPPPLAQPQPAIANMAGLPFVSTTKGTTSDRLSRPEPNRTPRTMQTHDTAGPLQSAPTGMLEATNELGRPARNTPEAAFGVTGHNVSASHNASDSQHDVKRERERELHPPQPDPESHVNTEANDIDTNSQSAVADGTPAPIIGVQQTTSSTHEPESKVDPSIPATAASETATAPTSNDDALTNIYLSLYLDEKADHDDPVGCVTLTGLTTRDAFFNMVQEDLESELELGDKIVLVKIRRADGKAFQGSLNLTMPIKPAGQQDMWQALVKNILKQGAGEGGLRGYVKVKNPVAKDERGTSQGREINVASQRQLCAA